MGMDIHLDQELAVLHLASVMVSFCNGFILWFSIFIFLYFPGAYTAEFEGCERTPLKISTCGFFSLFAFSHRGLFSYKWIESEWVWQAFFCNTRTEIAILKLQENCNGGGRVGRGPGRVIDIAIAIAKGCERDAQGICIAVRVVEAMWCSVAIRAATIEKKRAVFECLGGRL